MDIYCNTTLKTAEEDLGKEKGNSDNSNKDVNTETVASAELQISDSIVGKHHASSSRHTRSGSSQTILFKLLNYLTILQRMILNQFQGN